MQAEQLLSLTQIRQQKTSSETHGKEPTLAFKKTSIFSQGSHCTTSNSEEIMFNGRESFRGWGLALVCRGSPKFVGTVSYLT